MRIESGPTGERRVRTLLMLIMVGGFSIWFAYDGYYGYPAKNFQEHLQQLATPEERQQASNARVYPDVVPGALAKAADAVNKIGLAAQRQALEQAFGGPPSHEGADAWYYFGPSYRIKIPVANGRLGKPSDGQTQKNESDIMGQKALALILAVAAVYCLWFFVRVLRTHLVLDDGGLSYRGRGPIRWEDMKGLDITRFSKKGWVDLLYDDNGTRRTLRLDEYHLAKFDEVIDAICARKAFENPLPVKKTESPPSP